MPRGPKGEKRPADVIGNAVLIARIAVAGGAAVGWLLHRVFYGAALSKADRE